MAVGVTFSFVFLLPTWETLTVIWYWETHLLCLSLWLLQLLIKAFYHRKSALSQLSHPDRIWLGMMLSRWFVLCSSLSTSLSSELLEERGHVPSLDDTQPNILDTRMTGSCSNTTSLRKRNTTMKDYAIRDGLWEVETLVFIFEAGKHPWVISPSFFIWMSQCRYAKPCWSHRDLAVAEVLHMCEDQRRQCGVMGSRCNTKK